MKEFVAIYSWNSELVEDLPLKEGTEVVVLEQHAHGWWMGLTKTMPPRKGFFPKIYVRSVDDKETLAEPVSPRGNARPFSLNTIEAFDALVDNGFAIEDLVSTNPEGALVAATSRVSLTLSALIWDGANIEAHIYAEGPLTFTVGASQVPVGLEQGVIGLKVGDKANIISSPLLSYGDAGLPPSIPPNVHLVFSIEITNVQPAGETIQPAEGNSLFLVNGVSPRVPSSQANSALAKKVKAIVLVPGKEKASDGTTEITDDMLAQAAAGMGVN